MRAIVGADVPLATTSAQGAMPILNNSSLYFLNGLGAWAIPSGGGGGGGQTSLTATGMTITGTNTTSTTISASYTTGASGLATIYINGLTFTDHDANPAFYVTTGTICAASGSCSTAWNSTNAGFSLATTDTATIAYTTGASYLAIAGGTMTGELYTAPSTSVTAGLNLGGSGATPISPANGDVWITTSGMYARINGVTVGPFSAGGLAVGTTTIAGGTNGSIEYNNSGVLGELATTGSGSVVRATSPTLVTPALGTPASVTLTNATGLPLTSGVTGVLPVANGGTGTTSPGLVAGSNVTVTGSWPNQTIASTGGGGVALPQTVSGTVTSGGIPYFNSTTQMSTSALLAANALVVGGGAGAPPATVTTGTGVITALGNTLNATGGVVGYSGALGTPTSGTLTNATGLPISTGVSGLGSGVATALGLGVNAASGFPLVNSTLPTVGHCLQWGSTGVTDAGGACTTGGGGGTVSSGNTGQVAYYAATGTTVSGATTGTGVLTALGVNVGSAGAPVLFNGALGTPSSGTLTNATGLPAATGIASGALPSGVTINNSNWSGTGLSLGNHATLPANTIEGNATGASAVPTALAVPSCSGASNALTYTTSTGFGCNTISTGGVAFPVTVSGTVTSGGVPYFSSTTNMATSAVLAANALVVGGGAGVAPSTVTTGTGVVTALGSNTNATGGVGTVGTSGATVGLLNGVNTHSGTETLAGSSSIPAAVATNIIEPVSVQATALSGSTAATIYPSTASVYNYTANPTAAWAVNIAWSAGTSLNTALATGQAITVVMEVNNGATAYVPSAYQIDGSAVTPNWQGGTAPSAGDASVYDIYTFTVQKTASATYTVFASMTKF
jgi:hypothetical protein